MESNNKKNKSQSPINTSEKISLEIPIQGSLGLLAYGHKGIIAWRKKRDEIKAQESKK